MATIPQAGPVEGAQNSLLCSQRIASMETQGSQPTEQTEISLYRNIKIPE